MLTSVKLRLLTTKNTKIEIDNVETFFKEVNPIYGNAAQLSESTDCDIATAYGFITLLTSQKRLNCDLNSLAVHANAKKHPLEFADLSIDEKAEIKTHAETSMKQGCAEITS